MIRNEHNPFRLVLADDHNVLRVGLKAFLEETSTREFKVVGEAATGTQAIALVETLKPDLLVLDLSMPGMGGLDTTLEIRKRGLRLPILILTQFNESIILKRLLEAGANGYLLKSARGEELVSALHALLRGGTYIDPTLAGALVSGSFQNSSETDTDASDSTFEELYTRLTPREKQVLKMVAEGASNKDIANTLEVAVKTVMAHRMNLMDKLQIHNRSKLIQFAIRVGLLPLAK